MSWKRDTISICIAFFAILTLTWGILSPVAPVFGDEKKKKLPPRGIDLAPEYTGIIVPKDEDVSMDLKVINRGQRDENILLSVSSVPEGWKARIKGYSFDVKGVRVASDSSKSLTFRVEPDESVEPGDYSFSLEAKTEDGKLKAPATVSVAVKEVVKEQESEGVNIITSYPVLKGPTDAKFEFSFEVKSKLDKDTIFNLGAMGPQNWEINFKPAYEDKYISSLRIKANQSETMAVEVKPHALAEAGTYPIKVKVTSEDAKAEAEVMVVLTGTYKLDAGTANGLLSLNALQGREANLSFYVKNSGSATQNNLGFLSFKPENWKVEFKPERIDTIAPGDLKQVEAIITPAEQALVGDYSVTLRVEGEKASKNMEFRVTVRASTAWGWIGIGIIIFVIAGLVLLFVKMGRR
jgi:uncharacterized membrane protein